MTSAPEMTCLPAALAARTRGVSAGKATTSKTALAAATWASGNARASASGPVMPSGVTLTMISAPGWGSWRTRRQPAAVVDDRVDRVDRLSRRRQLVHEGDHRLLERHRHRAAADAERADAADRTREVAGGKRLVGEVQPELVVEVVMETGAEVGRSPRERDAQNHVLIQNGHRGSSSLCAAPSRLGLSLVARDGDGGGGR